MAPKRKRPDRTSVDAGDNRPSPHRPGNANLAQHDRPTEQGGRRSSRGGQGGQGRGSRRNERENPNKLTVSARATPTPGPMSPPVPRPSGATQTPTPSAELPSPIIILEPAPFDYTFLTDERMSSWETNGRQEVIAAGVQSRQDEDTMDLTTIFQELIRATLDGRIEATDGGNCVKEILGPDTASADDPMAFDPPTFFIDTFSMMCELEEKFNPVLQAFIFASGISPISLRHKLDSALLTSLALTQKTFYRIGIRQATHLLYRQANYNLLREETEGYSKLMTELFTTSGSEPPSAEVVEEAFEKVKGLIGTFDLDVGRVLDITLDVFAAVLIKQFRFFVKLLRASSWWPRESEVTSPSRLGGIPKWALPTSLGWLPTEEDEKISKQQRSARDTAFWERAREVGLDAFFELGGRQVVDVESKKRILGGRDADTELDADRQWIEGTGTFPPSGNRVAAQLLGFKLRFYASPARDSDDVLPSNLIYLTALLIKIGFVSLRDLYPHLWPMDGDMEGVREKKLKELQEKEKLNRPGGGGSNALMMAGALADDTAPSGSRIRDTAPKIDSAAKAPAEVEDKDKLDEPMDQKVQLLINLLTIGALPEALFMLGRFPWLPEAYPELLELIHRILNYSIKDVYETVRPISSQDPQCSLRQVPDSDQNGVLKGQVRLVPVVPRKQLRWPFPDKFDTNENLSYRLYWDEWADNIPVCQTVDDVFTLCGTLLNYSGVNIGRDSSLLSKLARIGAKSLSEDHSQHNLERWQDLLKRLLVPALSLTKSNTSVANEIYDMLRFYPVPVRYSIYAEWYEGQTSRLPAMKAAFARTRLETLSTMKRISMTNFIQMARSLAKTAYASPGIVFSVALSQIEAYTNLTEVVVECARYFTDLGYDVLVWSLMSSLGGKDRNRNNAEFALLPSRWLLALSRFSGKVFKRYSIMNLSPILQYVNDQLYRGNSTDLVILKELIAQMAGVVPDTDFTDAQLTAMTGGPALRRQTLINLQDKRYESTKTAKRLMKALTETRLSGQLLILIAQHRQAAIYNVSDDEAHIKMLATMVDDAQLILFQYLDLLRSNLLVQEFDRHVPNIPELMADFGLDTPLAFMIGRASLAERISKFTSPAVNGVAKLALPDVPTPKTNSQPDISMDGVSDHPDTEATIVSQEPTEHGAATSNEDVNMEDVELGATQRATSVDEFESSGPYHEVLEPIVAAVEALRPEGSWNAISSEFYTTFWALSISDLSVPSRSYDVEMSRLMDEGKALLKDRSDMSRPGIVRKEEAKKALDATIAELGAEFTSRAAAYTQRKTQILGRKSSWFDPSTKADIVSDAVLEKCIIPRVLLSPSDADYCFKLIKLLHENAAPNFRTLSLFGRLFKAHRLRALIFTCTVREAENLGRFFRLILNELSRWHKDSALYEKEAWGQTKQLPGFAKAVNPDGTPKSLLDHDGHNGFKFLLFQWHKNLNTALRDCLEGTEWMHIRNAITVLKAVVDVFPAVDFMGNGFAKQLETVAKREKDAREDLSLTGNAVLVQLKKKSKSWVMVQAFSSNIAGAPPPNGTTGKAQANGTSAKSALQPTAPQFKPGSRASSIGVSAPKASAPAEVEDGEVDDAKVSTKANSENSTKAAFTADFTTEPRPSTPATSAASGTPKSDVLVRREQILRERQEAKAAAATSSGASGRPESSRNVTPGSLPQKSTNLPNRPDAPIPAHRELDRHQTPRHGDRRDGRDPRDRDTRSSRLPDPNRLDRPGDRPREFDRRDPGPREFGRASDRDSLPPRDTLPQRDRTRPEPPPRWTSDSQRENADRLANNARGDMTGRLSRDSNMPPPRSSIASADRGLSANPERLPLVNSERQELINFEHAALITGGKEPARSDSPRRSRDDPRDRTSSRPQSPGRHTSERDFPEFWRDDRAGHNGHADAHTPRRGEEAQPPAGPRSERSADRASDRASDRPRDASTFQPSQPPRLLDPDHGRLNPSPRQVPDPNFGRLNPAPVADIPSGPRDRTSRGNRPPNPPPNRRDGRLTEAPRPPTPEKQVPTGPSSNRQPRRTASGQFDQLGNSIGSVPITPAAASPATGIHPDRLKHLGPQAAQSPQPSQPPAQPTSTGIHPDRLKALNDIAPAPSPPTNNSRSRPPMPSVATGGPPAGPKGPQSSPISSGPNVLSAPTGPASAVERAQRGGRRQLGAINTMLQQAGQQNNPGSLNVRGRGARMGGGMQPETPNSAPATPILPPPPPPGRPEPARDLINPDRVDLITGGATSEDRDRDRNSGRRERSGRHSRKSSRSPPGSDRTRDSKRGPHEDELSLKRGAPEDDRSREPKRIALEDDRAVRGEHRDRRGSERDPERDRHQGRDPSREQGRDLMGPRDGGRDREREREYDRESGRRDGRYREGGRDPHKAGWTGANERGGERGGERGSDRVSGGRRSDMRGDPRGSGEPRGEERRDGRGSRDDPSRKRRSEGHDIRDDNKRTRR